MDLKKIFNDILTDEKICKIYDEINRKNNYVIDHGKLHIMHVLEYIENICNILNIDEKTKYLTLIAGTLHDVGRMSSKEEHSIYGAEFARNYLKNKMPLLDINIICEAIKMHDRDYFDPITTSAPARILILADKIDFTRSRYIPELIDEVAKNKFGYNVESINLQKHNNKLIMTITEFENKPELNKMFLNMNLDFYKDVLSHFNLNLDIVLKIKI